MSLAGENLFFGKGFSPDPFPKNFYALIDLAGCFVLTPSSRTALDGYVRHSVPIVFASFEGNANPIRSDLIRLLRRHLPPAGEGYATLKLR